MYPTYDVTETERNINHY